MNINSTSLKNVLLNIKNVATVGFQNLKKAVAKTKKTRTKREPSSLKTTKSKRSRRKA